MCFCRVFEQQRSMKVDLLRTASVFVPASSRQGSIVSLAVPLEESYLSKRAGRRPKNRPSEERGRLGPRAGIPKRLRSNCHSMSPQKPWGGHPKWAGPLTTSLRGLWVSGYLPRAMVERAKGRRPWNRPSAGGDDSDPVLATRRERDLTANPDQEVLSNQRGHCTQGRGAQGPQCVKGRGPKDPGVAVPLPAAVCRGNCWRDTGGRFGLLAGLMDSAFCRST